MKNISCEQKNQAASLQQIKDASFQISYFGDMFKDNPSIGEISNNLKFIALGGDYFFKIWKQKDNKLLKQVKLKKKCFPQSCRFSNDSKNLYMGTNEILYKFSVASKFKIIWKSKLHNGNIRSICVISEQIILTLSFTQIIKTDVYRREQLLKINAYKGSLNAIDYNTNFDIIASGSLNGSIKLWDGITGTQLQEYKNAHYYYIKQLLFNLNNNQLLSLDYVNYDLKFWDIDYQTKQLQEHKKISQIGYNVSFVGQQQYIVSTCGKMIKFYTFEGELIRTFHHTRDLNYYMDDFFSIKQPDSMKGILMIGKSKLQYYIRGCIYLPNLLQLNVIGKQKFYMIIKIHMNQKNQIYYFKIILLFIQLGFTYSFQKLLAFYSYINLELILNFVIIYLLANSNLFQNAILK